MSKKLIFFTSFVLVLALAGANTAFGAFIVEVRVVATNDDAEETVVGGGMSRTSSDLELGYEGVFDPGNLQIIGVRFTGVGIPKDVTIRKAWVQFTADDINNDYHIPPVSLVIEGELSPDPVDFSSGNPNISSRATTTASEVWDIPQWMAPYLGGPDERTPDISSIIQEIIDQDGWAAGNAMVVILKDNPANPSQGTREAESVNEDIAVAPLLHIEYTVKTATEPNPADGGIGGPEPLMQWTKGDTAVYHDVYFGTSPELGPDDYIVRYPWYPWAMYWHVPLFIPGTTYYWRIDEVEADGTTIYTGNVWSFLAVPLTAHSPDPPDGNKTVLSDAVFSWGAGATAASHDVYFGTNRADVAAGTGGTLKSNQMEDTYNPKGLENGTAYFWRIDEVEADGTTKHTGEVWSFKTLDDPAFIGWWKLDEGQGGIAYDSSGYGHHGILGGNPEWVLGAIDGGLLLDGDEDRVTIDCIAPMVIDNNFSLSAWIKTEQMDQGNVFASNDGGSHHLEFGVMNGNVAMEDDGPLTDYPPKIADNQWHMITYVRVGDIGYAYVDGVLRGEDLADDDPAGDDLWQIGHEWDESPSDEFEGIVDDARFWIRPLSAEEVAEVFKGDVDLAHSPQPAYGSIQDIRDATPLSWLPGEMAAQHDVYFGTDELSVQGADASDTTNIYRGRQIGTSYIPPEGVEWDSGPYYWRIDEYNTDGTISEGKVWNFTVADYLIVDDFEDYNDYLPDEIWRTWVDGYGVPANGSTAGYPEPLDFPAGEHYMETTIVHGGSQSMPFFYGNTGTATYSEGKRTFAVPQNWTQEGVQTLVLYFYGTAGNTGQLYVKVSGVKVPYPGDAADIEQAQWNQWNIDTASLNPQSVSNMSIGMDDIGASGTLYFDNFRLYRLAP